MLRTDSLAVLGFIEIFLCLHLSYYLYSPHWFTIQAFLSKNFEAVRAEAAGKSPIFDLIFSKIVVFDSKSVIFASNVGLISFPFEKLKLLLTKPIVNMGIEEEPVSDSEKVSMKSSKFAKSLFNHLFKRRKCAVPVTISI